MVVRVQRSSLLSFPPSVPPFFSKVVSFPLVLGLEALLTKLKYQRSSQKRRKGQGFSPFLIWEWELCEKGIWNFDNSPCCMNFHCYIDNEADVRILSTEGPYPFLHMYPLFSQDGQLPTSV